MEDSRRRPRFPLSRRKRTALCVACWAVAVWAMMWGAQAVWRLDRGDSFNETIWPALGCVAFATSAIRLFHDLRYDARVRAKASASLEP